MNYKKSLMGFAALLILIFHIGPAPSSAVETFLIKGAYYGVDLFFFISALSLGRRKEIKYREFITNRLIYIYTPFVIFAVINAFYKKWKLTTFLSVISGLEFLKRGGGAFLWFVTGIMLIYLVAPLLVRLKNRIGLWGLPLLIGVWAIIVVVMQYGFGYTKPFIFLNRLPIFFLGLYYEDWNILRDKKWRPAVTLPLLIAGGTLIWFFGTTRMLNQPIKEFYYIIAIPMVLAVAGLFEYLSGKISFRIIPLEFIGKFTLELYGLQMVFGFDLAPRLLRMTGNKYISSVITALILILGAFIFNALYGVITKQIVKRRKQK